MLPSPQGNGSGIGGFSNAIGVANIANLVNSTMQPGDTLKLGSGNYGNIVISITSSGTAALRKTLIGEDTGGGLPYIKGSACRVNLGTGASYWTIANLDINPEKTGQTVTLYGLTAAAILKAMASRPKAATTDLLLCGAVPMQTWMQITT